ncbi:MAG: transglutaminase domain-containing protein [Bacteroidales bacterium]|nr:transglutaminase domain-containing protein [Bacteroidales bacterium]
MKINLFQLASLLLLTITAGCGQSPEIATKHVLPSDTLAIIEERIALDFPYTGMEIDRQLRKRIGKLTAEEKTEMERRNWLEYKVIKGEKRYFSRAALNLQLMMDFHFNRASRDSAEASLPEIIHRKSHTKSIINDSETGANPVLPMNMTINYTLTVFPDAVPHGETVRCWLPYPREDHPRQGNVKLISALPGNYLIAPDSAVHRTLYLEAKAEKEKPVVFNTSFSLEARGQYFDPVKISSLPYDTASSIYMKYTAEQLPHICFTEDVKRLADSIAGEEGIPFEIYRKIYLWFTDNIPWAGAQEYSLMSNIPEYVIKNRRGDCGMQTFLLMSMLRYKGIPVRWQSGWKVPPGGKNLHDWCEVYFEGTGWIPADISYGLQYTDDRKLREFYISGIDSYRLIINKGVAGILWPEKTFMRSEPFDFQRGEVEWKGGNLYFDKWDYEMEIIYDR